MFQPSTTCLTIIIFESVGLKIEKKKKAETFLPWHIVSSYGVFVCLFFICFCNFFLYVVLCFQMMNKANWKAHQVVLITTILKLPR